MPIPVLGAIAAFGAGMGTSAAASGILGPLGNIASQYINQHCPNNIPAPSTLIDSYRKGIITDKQLRNGLNKLGYGDQAIDSMLAATAEQMTPAELTDLYHKGIISENEYKRRMRLQSYDESQIDNYLKNSAYVFAPSDILRQQHYNNLSAETRRALGWDVAPTDDFVASCKAKGMTDSQIQDAWDAHWELPGANLVLDQLHKGLVTPEEAKEILKAQGMSDAAADNYLSAGFATIPSRTAGTIFMNHGMEDEDLYNALIKNGYSPEQAQQLVDYYRSQRDIKDEKAAAAAAKKAAGAKSSGSKKAGSGADNVKNKDLTIGMLKSAYYYGELTAQDCLGLLMSLGYDDWEAALQVSLWDAELAKKDRQDQIDLAVLKYHNGLIDEAELRNELASLNLKATAIEIIVVKNTNTKLANGKLPTVANLVRWLKKGIIDEDGYIDYMIRLNYPPDLAQLYYLDATTKATP